MLTSTNRRIFSLLAACLLLTVLVFAAQAEPVTARALPADVQRAGEDTFVYLPVIANCKSIISGRVTFDGAAAPGIMLTLELTDGDNWTVVQQTKTAADGSYQFSCMAEPTAGFYYEVWYENGSVAGSQNVKTDQHLTFWVSKPIQSLNGNIAGVNFDIADVELLGPFGTVQLPATFTWTKRSITADKYRFYLFEPNGILEYTSNSLGYVNSYKLNSLPSGFTYSSSTPYGWSVVVDDGSGGMGIPYWYIQITLKSSTTQSNSLESQPLNLEQVDRASLNELRREMLPLR
ncbi:MAG TPA: hypothetical protein VFF68_09370 [Anaerolineaceae bacterium]|nr:hypothetical protein [Anaerolineaceae bacterium]